MTEQYSKYFQDSPARDIGRSAWATLVANATLRHHDATGDWEQAAQAGVRASGRWALYVPFAIGMVVIMPWFIFGTIIPAVAIPFQAEGVAATWGASPDVQPALPNLFVLLLWLLIYTIQIAGMLLSYPYALGVLLVRNVDRNLMRVNHQKWYKRLLPYAYRMRNIPDWKLYLLPLMAWVVTIPLVWIATLGMRVLS